MSNTERHGRRMAKFLSAFGMAVLLMVILPGIVHRFENRNAPHGDNRVTVEEYNKIQNGMTYRQVEDIIGGPGGSSNVMLPSQGAGDVVNWAGKDPGQFITVRFDGPKKTGKVSSVTGFGFDHKDFQ